MEWWSRQQQQQQPATGTGNSSSSEATKKSPVLPSSAAAGSDSAASGAGGLGPSSSPSSIREPMPNAIALLRVAARREGLRTFFGLQPRSNSSAGAGPSEFELANHPSLTGQPSSIKVPRRMAARKAVPPPPLTSSSSSAPPPPSHISTNSSGRRPVRPPTASGRSMLLRTFTYIPPYAIGFLVYAIVSGDLA
jgi:hypothetical protein